MCNMVWKVTILCLIRVPERKNRKGKKKWDNDWEYFKLVKDIYS